MSTATLYDVGAPTLEVRIYDHDRLLATELCESEDDAREVVERWQDVANLFVVADDLSSKHRHEDVLAPDEPLADDDDYPSAPVPASELELVGPAR